MVFFQLPHVSYHYTEIPLQLANLSSYPVGNLCNIVGMFLSPSLFVLFDHLFEDGIPLIVVLSFQHFCEFFHEF